MDSLLQTAFTGRTGGSTACDALWESVIALSLNSQYYAPHGLPNDYHPYHEGYTRHGNMEISPSPSILMEVYIDRVFCNGCGICEEMCSMGVFQVNPRIHKAEATRPHLCIGCFKCREFCPTQAIIPRWIMRVS